MAIIMKTINGLCSKSDSNRQENSETKDIENCIKANKEAYYDNVIDQTMSDSFIANNMGPESNRKINFGLVNGFLEKSDKEN